MKKILMTILLVAISAASFSQIYCQANMFSYSLVDNGNYNWSNWEPCDVPIVINLPDYIYVDCKDPQLYKITSERSDLEYDNNGGKSVSYNFVDKEGVKGTVKLRIDPKNNKQVYIYYRDVAWIYNLRDE